MTLWELHACRTPQVKPGSDIPNRLPAGWSYAIIPAPDLRAELANAAAREVCDKRGVRFVDITPASRDRGGEPDQVAEDGLHPSAAMYTTWTGLVLPVVRQLLSS